ncbi:AAA family ATPase [Bacillus thuringiensis]|uniref:Nuclease SbcCD subunit C n=1 Tax=Bacillus thuringiensis subsp. higo TaxID=132266 RepID=A0A9X6L8Q7_BACUH|nr:AAA family ATPase [Bacillus thuringiensis]OUB39283.1 hypothetical protein BK716_32505 [Bacillus thuringiensis serovar higo]
MGIKIKKIELGAFRAYEEKQVFDFTNSKGQVANLVVIFAPNGFGKTSLLDAIEWGLTKEIHRFANNEVLKKVTKTETGIILKNRNSATSNGFVKFTDDEDQTLLINTKVTGRKYRSDYNDGIEVESSSELQNIRERALAKDNILSHDKIESFLLFSSGEERYKALAKFWDYSNDSENYKIIFMLLNEVKKEIASQNKILKEISKDIKDIHLPIEEINLYISKINNFDVNEISINILSNSLSEKDIDKIIIEVLKQKSVIKDRGSKTKEKISHVNYLLESLAKYNDCVVRKKELEIKVNDVQNHIKRDTKRDGLNHQKEKEYRQLELLKNRLEKVNVLESMGDEFKHLQDVILRKKTKIGEKKKGIISINKANTQISTQILDLGMQIEETEKNYDDNIKVNEILVDNAISYSRYEQSFGKIQRRISRLNNIFGARNQRFQDLDLKVKEIENLLKLETDDLMNCEFDLGNYQMLMNQLKELRFCIEFERQKREKKKEEYKQLIELNDDFNALLKVGKKVIETSKVSDCPMCSTPFDDYNKLIKQIDGKIGDVFQLDIVNQELKEIDLKIKNQEKNFKDNLNLVRSILKNDWNKLVRDRNEAYNKLQRIKNSLDFNTSAKEGVMKRLIYLESYFKEYNEHFDKKEFDRDIQWIRKDFVDRLEILKKNIYEQEKQLNILKEKLNNNKKLILQNEKELNEIEEEIQELQLGTNYMRIIGILKELEIPFNKEAVLKEKLKLDSKYNSIQESILKIEKEIENIDEELSCQGNYELSELKSILKELNLETNNHYDFITKYQSQFKGYFSSKPIISEVFDEELHRLKQILEVQKELITNFEILEEKLHYSKEVLGNSIKVKEREELILELKKLDEIQKQLVNSLGVSQNLIIEKINKAFNLEVINKIYSRIEPHPELKFMEISPAFIGDKLSLEIYAPIGEERKDNPVLFFSSAQLDILSLSIFFAKAIMEQDPILNTIFMDDPVHHMDSINILSFIDLLRTFSLELDRQIVITTHNENLFKLIEQKMDSNYCNSKFIKLDSHGKIALEE